MQRWELLAVEPGPVRVPLESTDLFPAITTEVIGLVWRGKSLSLDAFLETAGSDGWQIAGVGNIGDRRHRIYLQRPRRSRT